MSGNSYFAYQQAKKNWLENNPGKTEKDWDSIGVAKQDEYVDAEMEKEGFDNGTYTGSGSKIYKQVNKG